MSDRIILQAEISEINEKAESSPESMVEAAENRFNDQLCDITNKIKNKKLIMLSGPSSAGKTTSSLKLCRMLGDIGMTAHTISLDNFFYSKSDLPKLEDGEYDFESPNCIDIPLFTDCMTGLLAGKKVDMPKFNFYTGLSEKNNFPLKIGENDIVFIEGIHALNPAITAGIPDDDLFRIFISIRGEFVKDGETMLCKRDLRLVRRVIRDARFRNAPPELTFDMWSGVVDGEAKYISPFARRADTYLNSFFEYEPLVTASLALPLLKTLFRHEKHKKEAKRLSAALKLFGQLPVQYVPGTSLLREFVGGSDLYDKK